MTAKQHLIEQLRNLPKHQIGQHPRATLIQADAAGRLVFDAMKKGFIESGTLQDLWHDVDTQPKSDRFSAFWIVIFQQMLSGAVSSHSLGWEYKFSDDCRLMADMIEGKAEAEDLAADVDAQIPKAAADPVTKAIDLKRRDPKMTDKEIADQIGRNPSFLSRSSLYQAAKEIIEKDKFGELPKGSKSKEGQIEAQAR